jgi:hypothetical protein
MREKGNRVQIRLNDADNENLNEIAKRAKWSRSETMRFCLNFTHVILSTMPAETIDAILMEQSKNTPAE